MPKRDKDTITLGSGKLYMDVFEGTMPTIAEICVEEKRVGKIKGGAALEYTETTFEEKDDLNTVLKIITTDEQALLKCGLITWNGDTLAKLIDRCQVTEADGKRTIKIGGSGNAQNKNYVICFHHEDKADGDMWVLIKGRNTAGLTITYGIDAGSRIEPQFRALPHDNGGTLIELIEEIPTETTPDPVEPDAGEEE